MSMTITKCPTCSTPVEWSSKSPYRPFCSKRRRLIDLGAWLDGSNALPGEPLGSDSSLGQLDAFSRPANDEDL
jgi:endogenous inhibitor of DNA gyrase (YacG/DUF329 family)